MRPTTNRDIQRVTFVESLHNSLKKQACAAIADHKKFSALANSYLADGLEEPECVELLVIDGLTREAAESYVAMAVNKEEEEKEIDLPEYSFQFEENGRIWSSHDINQIVQASTEEEAWEKAQVILDDTNDIYSSRRVISVRKI